MKWSEKALEAIRARGGKLTPQRLAIVRAIEEMGPKHPTLTEVLERVRQEFPTVSFSTLYNNVLALKEAGLLRVFYHNGEARIEVNTEPHINIVIGDEVIDVDDPKIVREIEKRVGRRVLFVNAYVATEEGRR